MAQAINDALIQSDNTAIAPGMPLVLMYHSVEPYQADPYLVTVSPPRFGQQMGWLARRGLRGVSMRELLSARAAGAGRGLVGLTFDDGYADFSRHALPVLRRYGFGATVFVIAGRLGGDNAWDPEGPRKRLMDAGEVRDLLAARAAGAGKGLVGLTFDDGYADFTRHALPVLRRYGFGATVFVIAGRLGGDNAWDPEGPRKRLMDGREVRELAQDGIEIGSHGLRHVRLPAARDSLAEEVGGSRLILQEITGDPVGGFCYPYGDLDADTVTRVRDMGYDYGCAIWPSAYTSRLALPRTYIGEADTAPRLWAKTARHRLTRQNRLGPVLGRPARAA